MTRHNNRTGMWLVDGVK